MKATTVKVDGSLLRDLERMKPAQQSFSAYVRALLQQAVTRLKMAEAADRYAQFVRDSADERAWLTEWDDAELAKPPRRRRR